MTVKVTLVRGARTTTEVPITASAGKLRAKAEITLRRRATKNPSSGGGGSGSSTSPPPRLCTHYLADLSGQSGGSLILVPC